MMNGLKAMPDKSLILLSVEIPLDTHFIQRRAGESQTIISVFEIINILLGNLRALEFSKTPYWRRQIGETS